MVLTELHPVGIELFAELNTECGGATDLVPITSWGEDKIKVDDRGAFPSGELPGGRLNAEGSLLAQRGKRRGGGGGWGWLEEFFHRQAEKVL